MAEELKISYFEKNPRTCPVCNKEFYHEMLLTGGGRLIAGNLRDDLRRTYEKDKQNIRHVGGSPRRAIADCVQRRR